jgi:hypothetical protein
MRAEISCRLRSLIPGIKYGTISFCTNDLLIIEVLEGPLIIPVLFPPVYAFPDPSEHKDYVKKCTTALKPVRKRLRQPDR